MRDTQGTSGRTVWSRVRRWLRVLVLGLLVGPLLLTVALIAVVALLLATQPGRDLVAGAAQSRINELIQGTLDLGRVTRLDPYGLRLQNARVYDPSGQPVLQIRRLHIQIDPTALLSRRLLLRRVQLAGWSADLAGSGRGHSGLLAALVDDSAPSPSPQPAAPSAWTVVIKRVHLQGGSIRLPGGALGPLVATRLALKGSARIDGEMSAVVSHLSAALGREAEPLVEQLTLRGRYHSAGPSRVHLAARAGSGFLKISAETDFGAEVSVMPVALDVQATAVGPELGRRLGAVGEGLSSLGRIRLTVNASGTLGNLRARAQTASAQGRVDASLQSGAGQAELRLALSRLRLDALVQGAPPKPLSGTPPPGTPPPKPLSDTPPPKPLSGTLRLALPLRLPASLSGPWLALERPWPVHLTATGFALGGAPLPRVEARGQLTRGGVQALVVQLRGPIKGRLRGQFAFAGHGALAGTLRVPDLGRVPLPAEADARGPVSLQLRARVTEDAQLQARLGLRSRNAALFGAAVQALQVQARATGALANPALVVQLRAGQLRVAGQRLRDSHLQLRGRSRRLAFEARSDLSLHGGRTQGAARLSGTLARSPRGVRMALHAAGRLNEEPFELVLEDGRVAGDDLSLRALSLRALGDTITLHNTSRRSGRLQAALHVPAIDLARLSAMVGLRPRLSGRLAVDLALAGPARGVRGSLQLAADEVAVDSRPPLDARLSAILDQPAGRLRLDAEVSARKGPCKNNSVVPAPREQPSYFCTGSKRTLARAELHGRLGRARALGDALRGAFYDAQLDVALDTATVQAYLPELALPVKGRGVVQLAVSGPLDRAALGLTARTYLQEPASGRPLRVDLNGDLRPGGGSVYVQVLQAEQRVSQATLEIEHPGGPLAWLQDPRAFLRAAHARADLDLSPRQLATALPDRPWPEDLGRLVLSGVAHAEYAPQKGPALDAFLHARWPRKTRGETSRKARGGNTGCSGAEGAADLWLQLQGRRLRAALDAYVSGRRVVYAAAAADFPADRVRPAPGPARLHDLGYDFRLWELSLADVPVVCATGAGRLSVSSSGRHVLSAEPRVVAAVEAKRLRRSRAAGPGVDLQARAELGARQARVHGHLLHDGKRSPFAASIPITFNGGRLVVEEDAPISAELELYGLQLDKIVGAQQAISEASGEVRARVAVTGTLQKPEVEGELSLHDVAFTASALSQPLHGISGQLILRGQELVVPSLIVRDGDGVVIVHGKGRLSDGEERRVSAQVEVLAKRFPVRSQGQVAAEASLEAVVDTVLGGGHTEVTLTLKHADVWLLGGEARTGVSLSPHPDIVDPWARARPPAPPAPSGTLTVRVRAPSDFWIKRDDFAVKLGADLQAEVDRGGPRVIGDVEVNRGYVALLGQVFDVDRGGKVTFVGSQPPNPVLHMTAVAEARRSGESVTVTIAGRANAPELSFQVGERPATMKDAMAALLPSLTSGTGSSDPEAQVGSFVAGMLAGMLAVTARRELGAAAPIIMFDPAEERVRAGLELDMLVPSFLASVVRGVYLEGSVRGGGQQGIDTGVRLELFFPHQLVGAGAYGPANTWSVDLFWEP